MAFKHRGLVQERKTDACEGARKASNGFLRGADAAKTRQAAARQERQTEQGQTDDDKDDDEVRQRRRRRRR
jgi:hypothetical protein